MSRLGFALLVISAVSAAGCAVGPRYHRPEAPANAGYAPAPLPESSAAAPVHGGEAQRLIKDRDIPFEWWQLFQSPALNALVERAFKANPTIASAQAALVQAQELVYAQQGYFFPTVAANYDFERQKIAGNLTLDNAPGVQGNGDNLLPPVQDLNSYPHTHPLFYNMHTAEVTVGFVPDVFGANRRQVESLAAQRDAQRFALEATYITLASNVVAAAIQEASLRAQIEATRQIIAAEEKSLQILRDQFQLGFAMRIDVAAQEAALGQAKMLLPPLQKQLEQTRDLIRALAGNLPNQDVRRDLRARCAAAAAGAAAEPACQDHRAAARCAGRRGATARRQRAGRRRGGRDAAAILDHRKRSAAMPTNSPGCSAPAARSGRWSAASPSPYSKAARCCIESARRRPRCGRPRPNIRAR